MYLILAILHSGKDKTMEIIKRSVVARDCKEGEMNRQNEEYFKVSESILHDAKNGRHV